jgi:hypothetical protein
MHDYLNQVCVPEPQVCEPEPSVCMDPALEQQNLVGNSAVQQNPPEPPPDMSCGAARERKEAEREADRRRREEERNADLNRRNREERESAPGWLNNFIDYGGNMVF